MSPNINGILLNQRKTVNETDLLYFCLVFSSSIIARRSVLQLLSVCKLYPGVGVRSSTDEVVSLNMRHQRLETGKVEESCRNSVANCLHQWLAVVVVVVEHWQWEPLGGGRGCLAPGEESGDQEEDGDTTGPHGWLGLTHQQTSQSFILLSSPHIWGPVSLTSPDEKNLL